MEEGPQGGSEARAPQEALQLTSVPILQREEHIGLRNLV